VCNCDLCQVDTESLVRPVSTTASPANVHNTLSHLRASITKRIRFRHSVRNSASAGTLPPPDDVDANNRDHYVSVEHQPNRRQSSESLESNSTDTIAARYADHQVPNPPTVSAETRGNTSSQDELDTLLRSPIVSAQNEGDITKTQLTKSASLNDEIDVPLPVTAAPSHPTGLMTSISTTGSMGGATAVGVDADYLAVSVDQQQMSSVSKHMFHFYWHILMPNYKNIL